MHTPITPDAYAPLRQLLRTAYPAEVAAVAALPEDVRTATEQLYRSLAEQRRPADFEGEFAAEARLLDRLRAREWALSDELARQLALEREARPPGTSMQHADEQHADEQHADEARPESVLIREELDLVRRERALSEGRLGVATVVLVLYKAARDVGGYFDAAERATRPETAGYVRYHLAAFRKIAAPEVDALKGAAFDPSAPLAMRAVADAVDAIVDRHGLAEMEDLWRKIQRNDTGPARRNHPWRRYPQEAARLAIARLRRHLSYLPAEEPSTLREAVAELLVIVLRIEHDVEIDAALSKMWAEDVDRFIDQEWAG